MAQEASEAGYQSIRDFIEDNWVYLSAIDENDEEVTRVGVSDDRFTWIHDAGDQVLEIELELSGSDADVPTPTTFEASEVFEVSSGGDGLGKDSWAQASVATDEDVVTIFHRIQVPELEE